MSTNGQLSSEDGSTRDYGKVEIMGLRQGMPVPVSICDVPFAMVVVEVPSAWTGDMHHLIGQHVVKGAPVVVVGEVVNVKLVVSGLCDIVQEEIAVIILLLYNTSRKIGNYSMAENLMYILSRDLVPGPKFPRYFGYINALGSCTLHVEVVSYVFSRLMTEECDLHLILVATTDPRLPARIPMPYVRSAMLL